MSKHGDKTKGAVLAAGLALWRADPAKPVSARAIARKLGMTHGGCLYHFGDAAGLADALATEAVRTGDAVLVPILSAMRHPATLA